MTEKQTVDIGALSDLRTPWCLRVAATLHIAEHIAAGVTTIDALAAAAGCDADALHYVLTHLVEKGIFLEPERGQFALNDAAQQMRDPGQLLDLDLAGIGGRMSYAWSTLLPYVRTGQPAYKDIFGLPFWEDLAANPDIAASFDALMGPLGHGTPDVAFQVSGGWDAVHTVVDVGGGTGSLLAEILRTYPHINGTLVDLPGTVARAAATFQQVVVSDRVRTVGQSFFDPLPAGADLYLLEKILSDWPDQETVAILRRCAEAARPNGRIMVLSGVTLNDEPPPLTIEMILLGGKVNTVAEFRELARSAGLEVVAVQKRPGGRLAVECSPVEAAGS